MIERDKKYNIPIWKKYALTIEEASCYFGIGENKLRKLISQDEINNSSLIIKNGSKSLVKRTQFEKYLDSLEVI